MPRLMAFLDSRAGRAVRYIVSFSIVAAFVAAIDWGNFWAARGHFAAGTAVFAVILAGASYPVHAWRWSLLLHAQGIRLGPGWSHTVTWIGQFYNSFLPGGLGGDAARMFYVCRDAPARKAEGIAATLLDRVMGFVVLLGIAIVVLVARAGLVAREPGLRWMFVIAATGALAAAVAVIVILARPPESWPAAFHRLLQRCGMGVLPELVRGIRSAKGDHAFAVALSVLIWMLDIIAVWLLARSVGLPLPLLETCLAVSVGYLATILPISIGGHGIREGAMLTVFGLLGVVSVTAARDEALLLGLLSVGVTVLWSLAGGLFLLAAPRLLPNRGG